MINVLDYRKVEYVRTAGLPITTFMAEDPEIIWVSTSDLISELGLFAVSMDFTETFTIYDIVGRGKEHICIPHAKINEFLWTSHSEDIHNLNEFRTYFSHEVMSFWNRFHNSHSNMTIREAFMRVDNGSAHLAAGLGLPLGRVREFIFECMGFKVFPNIGTLSTEEYAFMAYAEVLYLSIVTKYIAKGEVLNEAVRQVERELSVGFSMVGKITRGYSEL